MTENKKNESENIEKKPLKKPEPPPIKILKESIDPKKVKKG